MYAHKIMHIRLGAIIALACLHGMNIQAVPLASCSMYYHYYARLQLAKYLAVNFNDQSCAEAKEHKGKQDNRCKVYNVSATMNMRQYSLWSD